MVRRGRKLGAPVKPEDSPSSLPPLILGETGLYKWQMRALKRAARGKRVALRAANGSGKTDKVIGILALWFLWRYPPWAYAYYVRLMAPGKNQLWPALERHRNNPSLRAGNGSRIAAWKRRKGDSSKAFPPTTPGRREGWHGRVTDESKDERKEQDEEDPRSEKKARLFDVDEFTGR